METMTTKSSTAYTRIKRLIEGGHLKTGGRLTQARAVELTGVGHGPVRESLLRLEAEGLLRSRGGRRSRIVAYTEDQNLDEMLYHYELREQIEGGAARLAAKNMSGRQIDRLRELAQAAEDALASGDRETRYKASRRYHRFLVANCGNPLLLAVWRAHHLMPSHPRSGELDRRIIAEMFKADPLLCKLMSVVDAIAAHDPDLADAEVRRRVHAIAKVLRRTISERDEEGDQEGSIGRNVFF